MNPKTLYRDILKNSFNITFQNKILWFLGLFAAPLVGMAEYKIAVNIFNGINNELMFGEWTQIVGIFISQFKDMIKIFINDPISGLIILLIFFAIILLIFFLIWISVVAQCALIDGINQSNQKTITDSKLNLLISSAVKNFFPVFVIHFFVKLILTLSFLLLSLPLLAILIGNNNILPNILYVIFSLILIPITMIIMFSSKYAINYIIIEKERFFDSIKKGRGLFFKNWLISIEMSLILFFISIFTGIFIFVIGSFIAFPLMLLIYILVQTQLIFLVKFILIFGLVLLIILSLLFAAIFATFQYSSWVLLFNRLNKSDKKVSSRLVRWFNF